MLSPSISDIRNSGFGPLQAMPVRQEERRSVARTGNREGPLSSFSGEEDPGLRHSLSGFPLFRDLNDDTIDRIVSFSRLRSYRQSQIIIQAYDRGTELFLLISGSVKVSIHDMEGREITLSVLYPPDFFGEIALWDNQTRTANVSALELTQAISIEKDPLLLLIRQTPEITLRFLSALSARLRVTDEKLMHMAYGDAYEKVARTLFELLLKEGQQSKDGIPYINDRLSRQEIASLSGVTRETVSRSLGAFMQAGLLKLDNGRIYVLKPDRLKKEGHIQ